MQYIYIDTSLVSVLSSMHERSSHHVQPPEFSKLSVSDISKWWRYAIQKQARASMSVTPSGRNSKRTPSPGKRLYNAHKNTAPTIVFGMIFSN
jgi:hypothetical protein